MADIETRIATMKKAIGANLTALALAKGKTPHALHVDTQLPKSNVYRAMSGEVEPPLHVVVILAEVLGTSVDALLTRGPGRPPGKKAPRPKVAPSGRKLKKGLKI